MTICYFYLPFCYQKAIKYSLIFNFFILGRYLSGQTCQTVFCFSFQNSFSIQSGQMRIFCTGKNPQNLCQQLLYICWLSSSCIFIRQLTKCLRYSDSYDYLLKDCKSLPLMFKTFMVIKEFIPFSQSMNNHFTCVHLCNYCTS